MTKHLIVLEGGGDIVAFYCGPATYEWINSDPPDFTASCGYNEPIPQAVRDEAPVKDDVPVTIHVTSGSWDNDRAIHASCWHKTSDRRPRKEPDYEGCIY